MTTKFIVEVEQVAPHGGNFSCRISKYRAASKSAEGEVGVAPEYCHTKDGADFLLHQLLLSIKRVLEAGWVELWTFYRRDGNDWQC